MAHKLDSEKKLWEKAAAFHGHVCPGLTIGYRAALYAIDLLGLTFSDDEQVVCITENDACGVDAIQAILGCSIGKGNLLFHMTREETFDYYHSCADDEMFDVKETKIRLPEQARIFDSYVCDCCGETTGANWIRLSGDKKLCLDCYGTYDRFDV